MEQLYIVTGAAGHLGSTVIRKLKAKQREVCGLLLPEEKELVTGKGIRYIRGDVTDRESLRKMFESCGGKAVTVIHTAGIIDISGRLSRRMYEVNVTGTKNMLDLAEQYGVKRFVYVSSVHAIPENLRGMTIRETNEFAPEQVIGGYAKTKAQTSRAVQCAAEEGLDAVLIHPSGIIGPYDQGGNHLVQLIRDFMAGKLPACVRGGYDFVDVRDVAEGCILAADKGKKGQCYILSGENLSIRQLLTLAGSCCGRRVPCELPVWAAKAALPFIKLNAVRKHSRPLYTGYSLYTLKSNSIFSHEKAEKELGYRPRAIADSVRDMVGWIALQKLSV